MASIKYYIILYIYFYISQVFAVLSMISLSGLPRQHCPASAGSRAAPTFLVPRMGWTGRRKPRMVNNRGCLPVFPDIQNWFGRNSVTDLRRKIEIGWNWISETIGFDHQIQGYLLQLSHFWGSTESSHGSFFGGPISGYFFQTSSAKGIQSQKPWSHSCNSLQIHRRNIQCWTSQGWTMFNVDHLKIKDQTLVPLKMSISYKPWPI